MLKPNYMPLEVTLIRKNRTKTDLRLDLGLSGVTVAKIAKREYISLKTIAQICEYLNVPIQEVVVFDLNEKHED